jgi:hypothetical protein
VPSIPTQKRAKSPPSWYGARCAFHIQLFAKRVGSGFGPDLGALIERVLIRGGWLGQVGGAVGGDSL